MKKLLLLLPLVLLAACSLPGRDEMYFKNPMKLENEPSGNMLDTVGCLMGIQSTGAGVIGTYREITKGQESDTGFAPVVTPDGTIIMADVRTNWKKVAGWAGWTALSGAVTANDCRNTIFIGGISYWCGGPEQSLYSVLLNSAYDAVAVDNFFNSGSYRCDRDGIAHPLSQWLNPF